MPTDNPKISLYVPQQIYDRFKSFQEERKLSMSQAGIVIIAEYFGIEETIKEITQGTTVGGVTFAEFQELKQKVLELEEQVALNRKSLGDKNINAEIEQEANYENSTSNSQLKLISESDSLIVLGTASLAKRFGLATNSVSSAKSRHTIEKFYEWSKTKDPDGVGWIPKTKKDLIPKDKLPSELLNKLQKWIVNNI